MAHDDRMLSQAEIDSLLKRILPDTDKKAADVQTTSGKPGEPSTKPKEAISGVKPAASIGANEMTKFKETVPAGREMDTIKLNEYKMDRAEASPSSQPAEATKRESFSGEGVNLQTVASLTEQVNKLAAAVQTMKQLEEKVKQLEATIKIMPDFPRTLKSRVDEISNELEMLKAETSDSTFFGGFKCGHCRAKGLVAVYVKCTSCGKESWMGWWPDKEKK